MTAHAVPRTTHTMEQTQVAEINASLGAVPLSADDLGVEDLTAGHTLAAVTFEGSPVFGYAYGLFRAAGGDVVRVMLHTTHLRALSRALHLSRHHWGV